MREILPVPKLAIKAIVQVHIKYDIGFFIEDLISN